MKIANYIVNGIMAESSTRRDGLGGFALAQFIVDRGMCYP
jgi:hypothetical protein